MGTYPSVERVYRTHRALRMIMEVHVIKPRIIKREMDVMTLESLIHKASSNESGPQFPEGRLFVGCGCWIDGSDFTHCSRC